MAIKHPKIDHRTFNDIIKQVLGDSENNLQGLRDYYTQKKWDSWDSDDPGIVLTKLFGKLMETVLERLNRIPEKNFITFLDLLGIDRLPGNWARTAVRFLLPTGNLTGGFVPAGTQVATAPTESGNVYVFETEKGIFITPVSLKKIFSIIPADDKYTDISLLADASSEKDIEVVSGEEPIEHILYLAHDRLLSFSEPVDLILDIQIAQLSPPFFPSEMDWEVLWERYVINEKGEGDWLDMVPYGGSPPELTSQLLESGQIEFKDFKGTALSEQDKSKEGRGKARWIRAKLKTPLTPDLFLPQIEALKLGITINQTDVAFDEAFYNNIPIDLSKDLYPFGEEPKLADTFYLANKEAFSKPGASITLKITLSEDISEVTPIGLKLKWETWNGNKWKEVNNLIDGSSNFSTGITSTPSGGVITFELPDELKETEVNGVSNNWIRIRIVRGSYGKPAHYIPVPNTSPIEYQFVPSDIKPPILSNITLDYTKDYPLSNPEKCLIFNKLSYKNKIESIKKGESFYPFESIREEPALYLGFSEAFGDKAISLFFHITEKDSEGTREEVSSQVIWEYSVKGDNGKKDKWSRLEVEDSTNHLTTSGTVSFLGPDDFSQVEQFGQKLSYLRARFQKGNIPKNNLIKGIYLNTVWSANLITIRNEVLGSGNGKANQSLIFSQKPILLGEKIYVKEREVPSEEAQKTLQKMEEEQLGRTLTTDEKDKFVQTIENPLTKEKEIWVRWHQVDGFFASDAQSRHYVLDRINGSITFGDGQRGMIPPIGRDNIKAFFYQSGGGLLVNKEVKAGMVKELRSSLPFVDKVTNVVPAYGGSDSESVDDVLERGPQTIKNRNRAVTIEDFVWLAKQASTQVHQVKCLSTTNSQLKFEPGSLTLLIVPESDENKPRPSQELIRKVNNYLLDRCLSTIKPNIYIIPPKYIEVEVKAEVVATIPEESSVVEGRIVNRLKTFFHPVKGGPKSEGWEFGRNVYISEVYQLIEETDGVDVVLSVELNEDPLEIGDNELPVSGIHEITMKIGE